MTNCYCHCCCQKSIDDDDESTVDEPIENKRIINPERIAQGYKLAELMKKRKEEILRNKEQPAKKPIGDKLLMTTVAATSVEIFVSLRAVSAVQHYELLASTSLACLVSLPLWER